MKKSLKAFVSVGEFSGDILAADLILALQELFPRFKSFGITGQSLKRAGTKSIADIKEFNVMGFSQVLTKLPELKVLEQKILADIDRERPDLAILVDFPGFNFRLAEQLKIRGVKVVQYIAPKVWAWGEERVKRLKDDFDLVLGVFPFEQTFFDKHQVNFKYVGSPHLDRTTKVIVDREKLGIPSGSKLIATLPGSRIQEITRMIPHITKIRELLDKKEKNLQYIVPIAENLSFEEVTELFKKELGNPQFEEPIINHPDVQVKNLSGINFTKGMNLEIISVVDAAIITSGTATLEAALLDTPMVVFYETDDFSYNVSKSKLNISWISLVNILADKTVVPEFVQNFSHDDIVNEVVKILNDDSYRLRLHEEFKKIKLSLHPDAAGVAANEIRDLFKK